MGHEGHDHPSGDSNRKHERHHEHEHNHEHEHHHEHDSFGSRRDPAIEPAADPELGRGSGRGKVLFLDAPSGVAGDMIIAALVDLGVPARTISEAIAALPMAGFHLHFGTRTRSGIVATSFDVHVDRSQPPRTYASIRAMLENAPLDDDVRARSLRTFHRLAVAEAKIHRNPIDEVHFHEVGAVDAVVDVVGSAAALAYLAADLFVSPLPMGRGFVRAAHGALPLPAPATVECLAGLATYDAGMDFEFVTPTGAAIVGAHALGSSRWPPMAPERTGWGAGATDLADRPNLLRAVLGTSLGVPRAAETIATHAVLECNVDDATGELAGSWIESLLGVGALDAWAVPITMKKGRPAWTISALTSIDRADTVARAMLRETTSLGVRRYEVARVERPRTQHRVDTIYGPIPVKVAGGPFGPAVVKPEFEACAHAARTHGVPVREVLRVAVLAAASLAEH